MTNTNPVVRASASSAGGAGVTGLLGVAFIVLKLTGVISWPWIWVLAPFWIAIALWLVIAIAFLIIGFIYVLVTKTR